MLSWYTHYYTVNYWLQKALPWSVEEDDFLQSERHKHKNWMSLAWDLNALFGRARSGDFFIAIVLLMLTFLM